VKARNTPTANPMAIRSGVSFSETRLRKNLDLIFLPVPFTASCVSAGNALPCEGDRLTAMCWGMKPGLEPPKCRSQLIGTLADKRQVLGCARLPKVAKVDAGCQTAIGIVSDAEPLPC